jgi:Na+/proline symporter
MITRYDYIGIAFYFIFVITVGLVFSRRNKNTSDYRISY